MSSDDGSEMQRAISMHMRATSGRSVARSAAAVGCICCDGLSIAVLESGLSREAAFECFACEASVDSPLSEVNRGSSARVALGEMELVVLKDGSGAFDGRDAFSAIANDEWTSARVPSSMKLSFGCVLVRCPSGANVLLDTALGVFSQRGSHRSHLALQSALWRDAGLRCSDIDWIIHCSVQPFALSEVHPRLKSATPLRGTNVGETTNDVIALFSAARHVVQRSEWAFWSSDAARRARVDFEATLRPLEHAEVLHLVDGVSDITPTVSVALAPGRTPGGQIVWVRSPCGASAVHAGAVLDHPVQLRRPHWCTRFDDDPARSVAVRNKVLGEVSAEGALLLSLRLPFPGAGSVAVARDGGGFDFTPLGHLPARSDDVDRSYFSTRT